ncbi:MAG: IS3 family transposase [Pseudomonadota bacterium]
MAKYAIERGLKQHRACWLCSTPRSGLHYRSKREQRDRHLSKALRLVSRAEPAWGYRLAGGYLRLRGWQVNHKRIYRLWQLNGLSLPPYRPSRKIKTGARLDGLALRRNDVWAWDIVHDRYHDAEPMKCLTVEDEATGFCLAIHTARRIQSTDIKALLRQLIVRFGRPRAIRCDNGSELVATVLREELKRQHIQLANIDPGKPWQNGCNESFNGTFRRECLNAEIFGSLMEARVLIEQWRQRYNQHRPHSSRNYITPEMAYFGTEYRKS